MSIKKINIGDLYVNAQAQEPFLNAEADFYVCNPADDIVITKVVDRPNECYFPGDEILFTINITNTGDRRITGLAFKDNLSDIAYPIGNQYEVTTTCGTIVSVDSPVAINDITIEPKQTCIITIRGIVK